MSRNDTGESTASINARMDDSEWQRVLEGLQKGGHLMKLPKLSNYYVHRGNEYIGGVLTPARVRKLEAQGILVNVGVHRYALVEGT